MIASIRRSIFVIVTAFLLLSTANASMHDVHYTVAVSSGYSYERFHAPSVNNDGDILVTGENSSGKSEPLILIYDKANHAYFSVSASSEIGSISRYSSVADRDFSLAFDPCVVPGVQHFFIQLRIIEKKDGETFSDHSFSIIAIGCARWLVFHGERPNPDSEKFIEKQDDIGFAVDTGAQTIARRDGIGVSSNSFGQFAYITANGRGKRTVFSTNLGVNREIVTVGDKINGTRIESLELHDGLMDSGQVVYLAKTTDGEFRIVRTNRAYTQLRLNDSPVKVPWQDLRYLLRSTPEFPPTLSMGDAGCNLVTTANVLSYYANDVTPARFQEWLIGMYSSADEKEKYLYIDENNDFQEEIVEDFSNDMFNSGLTDTIVTYREYTPIAPGDNWKKLVSELRARRPVKLRVPSRTGRKYRPFGHFVLAYGLVNPDESEDGIMRADILIHDPGFGGAYTLKEYEQRRAYHITHPNWLDDDRVKSGKRVNRLYLYSSKRGTGPMPPDIMFSRF